MTADSHEPAGLALLRSLRAYGVEYVFGNFGTDHPPFLEPAAGLDDPDAIPELVICPHETTALSAAHGYAAATGQPQAVIVHVDVGTQNLGAMVHNAHRGNAPVFIIAGLAPHTHEGLPESRDSWVHFLQDVYDQPGIVRQFCRWTAEYRPPADPDEFAARGLELAAGPPAGPVYLSATRESLGAEVDAATGTRDAEPAPRLSADAETVDSLAGMVEGAEAPLVLTSKLGVRDPESSVASLVEFAERAGAGVVEFGPAALCFPRTHELHAGFDQSSAIERADLVILADVDVPWVPAAMDIPETTDIVQIDPDPEKGAYPRWDFAIDHRIAADVAKTLDAVADRLSTTGEPPGRSVWTEARNARREDWQDTVREHGDDGRLTAQTVAATIDESVGEETIVVNESTTNNNAVLRGLALDRPGQYYFSHGSGLGWAPGAAIGVKLANPDDRVITFVGDGSYVFANPTSAGWVQGAQDAPTLTVILNNSGWNAVHAATMRVHPEGEAAEEGTPGSAFQPRLELAHAGNVVDAYTETVESLEGLAPALEEAIETVDGGDPAVLDVHLDPI